jgi:hypothetical protein
LIVISLGIAWGSSMKLNLGIVPGIVVGA